MKRIISIISAVLMLCALCVPAFADDTPTSGSCGDNLSWSINDDHTVLTFTGSGDMHDYGYYSDEVPWWDYRDLVTTINFPTGITHISTYAFCYFSKIENVWIPADKVSLGKQCFFGCSSLKNLAIGTPMGSASESINIGSESFEQCENLENVFLSRALKNVDYDGFEQCYALKNFYYGSTETDYNKNVKIDMGSDSGNKYLTNAARKYRFDIWSKYGYDDNGYWREPDFDWPFSEAPFNMKKIDEDVFRGYQNDGKTCWRPLPDGGRANETPLVYTYDDTSYHTNLPDGTIICSGTFSEWVSDDTYHWHVLPNGEKVHIEPHSYKNSFCSVCNAGLTASYLDKDGKTVTASNVKEITKETSTLTGGAYIASGKVSIPWRLEVSEDTTLILIDGCELNIDGGIHVPGGKTLTICAQSTDANKMGRLTATATQNKQTGIGADKEEKNSHIVICGGRINATGGQDCAGIGSSLYGNSTVDIYNGIIEAHGGGDGAGIGAGGNDDCFVNIYNGNIKAWGGYGSAGIGGGCLSNFKVNIYNGTVEAWGGIWGSGIGSGYNSKGGAVYISKSAKAKVTGHGYNYECSDIDSLQDTPVTGFTLSSGNWWIIGIGAAAVIAVAAIVIVKKKKPAAANSEDD